MDYTILNLAEAEVVRPVRRRHQLPPDQVVTATVHRPAAPNTAGFLLENVSAPTVSAAGLEGVATVHPIAVTTNINMSILATVVRQEIPQPPVPMHPKHNRQKYRTNAVALEVYARIPVVDRLLVEMRKVTVRLTRKKQIVVKKTAVRLLLLFQRAVVIMLVQVVVWNTVRIIV